MRTTINLDDDVYRSASLYAAARGISLGKAVCELIRNSQTDPDPATSSIRITEHGLPVFRARGRPLTSKMVREALLR